MMVLVYDGKLKVSLQLFLRIFREKEGAPIKNFTSLFGASPFLIIS